MKYNRYLPLFITLFTWLLMEWFFWQARMIYVVYALVIILFFFAIRQFVIGASHSEKWWNLAILPICFFTGLLVFSTLIPNRTLIQALFMVNALFLYVYFRTIYNFLILPKNYKSGSLENISSYGNFLAFYFIASAMYGMQVFLNIDIWLLLLIALVFIGLIIYQMLWVNRIDPRQGVLYLIIICLILAELAWSASFLTLSYYVLGLLLAVCYYVLIGLSRFHLLNRLTKATVKAYLIFGFSSILAVLLTANWFSYN